MKKIVAIIVGLMFMFACSDEKKSDEYLLSQDKLGLENSLNKRSVAFYKFFKVLLRASAETDTVSEEFFAFRADFDRFSSQLTRYDSTFDLSVNDYIELFRSYRKMNDFLRKTDEDVFPTLSEVIFKISHDTTTLIRLRGTEKKIQEAQEHALLSVITMFTKGFGSDISLYECNETEVNLLPDSEFKTMIFLFRGFVFLQNGLYYLSEDEITRNIFWLENHQHIEFPITKQLFLQMGYDDAQTYLLLHSLNYLFRGFDRLLMERKKDEKRALEDFKVFLSDSKQLGADNELLWAVATYVSLKEGEFEEAIVSLRKLQQSTMFSKREKETIEQAIQYLEKRKSRKVLNGVFDKLFVSKIAISYFWSILSEIDWKQTCRENETEYAEKMFRLLEAYASVSENVEKYYSVVGLKETGKELKGKGEKIFRKKQK